MQRSLRRTVPLDIAARLNAVADLVKTSPTLSLRVLLSSRDERLFANVGTGVRVLRFFVSNGLRPVRTVAQVTFVAIANNCLLRRAAESGGAQSIHPDVD